ncbi:unnamed protein product [Mycena citricolor]|uniref:Uncharacterized protein n=1 Tax=Mycena citricolor TaxID=2018698 RepID=A0AAD2H865_9AGAR|nr:unnamed protein product [Mycena citricolor]
MTLDKSTIRISANSVHAESRVNRSFQWTHILSGRLARLEGDLQASPHPMQKHEYQDPRHRGHQLTRLRPRVLRRHPRCHLRFLVQTSDPCTVRRRSAAADPVWASHRLG